MATSPRRMTATTQPKKRRNAVPRGELRGTDLRRRVATIIYSPYQRNVERVRNSRACKHYTVLQRVVLICQGSLPGDFRTRSVFQCISAAKRLLFLCSRDFRKTQVTAHDDIIVRYL